MSLYWNKKISYPQKSLPRRNLFNQIKKQDKEAPLCVCRRGSYTLEAAIILPLVTGFLAFLLFFFRVMQVEYRVQEALTYAGRQAAVHSSVNPSETLHLSLAAAYLQKELKEDVLIRQYIKNGSKGITLLESKEEGEYIDLRASYRVCFPIGFFSLDGMNLMAQSRHRKWTGQTLGESRKEDPVVFYTETGSVYHLSKSCHYLDLSIHMCDREKAENLRNESGSKYSPCASCMEDGEDDRLVYVTDYGTAYHGSIQCSGLKRTIYEVNLSQVGNRKLCSKCG